MRASPRHPRGSPRRHRAYEDVHAIAIAHFQAIERVRRAARWTRGDSPVLLETLRADGVLARLCDADAPRARRASPATAMYPRLHAVDASPTSTSSGLADLRQDAHRVLPVLGRDARRTRVHPRAARIATGATIVTHPSGCASRTNWYEPPAVHRAPPRSARRPRRRGRRDAPA